MPIFEYRCASCGLVFEWFTFTHEKEEQVRCPKCQAARAEKIISPFSCASGCGPSGGGFS